MRDAPTLRVDRPHAEFRVHGLPAPQGSKTAIQRKGGGRPIIVEGKGPGRERHASWRQAVATAARDWQEANLMPVMTGPLVVRLLFTFPQSKSDPYRTRHQTRPDLDKLARSVLDALTDSGIIANDSQVWRLICEKRYARELDTVGAHVTITDYTDTEATDRDQLKLAARAKRRAS